MSDTTRLGVSITASDTASASIKSLQSAVRTLEAGVQQLGTMAASASAVAAASIQRETAAFKQQIAALNEVIAAKKVASVEGIRAAQQEAEYINRNMDLVARKYQAEIKARNAAAIQERNLIADTVQFEAQQLNQSMAAREARTRAAIAANNARVYQERAVEDANARAEATYINQGMTASATKSRTEAEYTNRDIDLARAKTLAEANYINQGMTAAQAKNRVEAEYANRDIDLVKARAQAEATYINQGMAAGAAKARAEAEYANRNVDLSASSQRAEAAYINRNADLAYAQMRREADLENTNFNMRTALRAREEKAAAAAATSGAEGGIMGRLFQPRMMRHAVALPDELMRGQRGAAFATIGAAARDAGLGVAALGTSMIGLVAIMGGAAILRGAEAMGKWATETRAAAVATGMSISQYSSLQAVLTSTGLRAQEADASMRKLSLSLSEALADKTSLAAEAFHNLGISQEMLIKNGQDVFGAMHLIADALRNTEGGANQAKNAEELLGRGLEHLIPLLQNGSAALDQNIEKQKEFGRILTEETAKKLEEVESHVRDLTNEVEGKGIQAFVSWGPAIDKSADALRDLLNVLSSVASAAGTVISAVATSGDELQKLIEKQGKGKVPGFTTPTLFGLPTTVSALFGGRSMLSEDITKYFQGKSPGEAKEGIIPEAADALRDRMQGKTAVPPLTTPVSQEAQRNLQMATAEAAASKGGSSTAELQAGIKVLQEWIAKDKEGSKEMIADRTALANKQKELNNELASAGKTAAKQSYADFASAEQSKISEAEGSSSKIKSIYDEWISAAISKYNQLGSVVDKLRAKELEQVNAAKRGEIMQRVKTDEQAATLKDLNDRLAAFQSGTAPVRGQKLGPTSDIEQAQQYIAQAQQVDAAYREQTASLKQYGATAEQVVALETQAKSKEVALYEKAAEASQRAAEKIMEPWTKFFDNIGSEFEGLTSSILSAVISPQITLLKEGLTTKRISESGNQIGAAFRKMLLDGINSAANSVQTSLSHMLANALSGGQANTLGELLSQKLTQGLTAIFPSLSGILGGGSQAAAGAALNTAGVSLNSAGIGLNAAGVSLDAAATALAASAAVSGGAGVMSGAGGLFSLASLAPAMLALKGGGIIPSAAGGMMVGGNGATLSLLHAREMVLPAPISMGLQAMIQKNTGGGGPTNTASLNYAPTINTGSRSRGGTGMSRGEFSQLLALHSGAMLGEARNMMRNGWRP